MSSKISIFSTLTLSAIAAGTSTCSNSTFSGSGGSQRPAAKSSSQTTPSTGASTPAGPSADGNANSTNPTDLGSNSGLSNINVPGLPKFGLMVNDLECGMCHIHISGDVVSTRDVPGLWHGSSALIDGAWKVKGAFKALTPVGDASDKVTVTATNGIVPYYTGTDIPSSFPVLDFNSLQSKMRGSVKSPSNNVTVEKVATSNTVLIGTDAAPIQVQQDVLIVGDLIIKGSYTGIGTIYVTGNIYIPFNLKAVRSAFPYPDNATDALVDANQYIVANSKDGLGLATQKSIFLADLEINGTQEPGHRNTTVYNHDATPANRKYAALGVRDVYNWYPGGQAGFTQLYGDSVTCVASRPGASRAGFNLVDAFLYAKNTVAGVARSASYSIRGGVVADYFHVISGASACPATTVAPNGKPSNVSYVEYDYRLKTGHLPILEQLGGTIGMP